LQRVTVAVPLNGVVNIGGPDKISFADLARTVLAKQGTDKSVVVDPHATYFGTPLQQNRPRHRQRCKPGHRALHRPGRGSADTS